MADHGPSAGAGCQRLQRLPELWRPLRLGCQAFTPGSSVDGTSEGDTTRFPTFPDYLIIFDHI